MALHKWVLFEKLVATSGTPVALSATTRHVKALYLVGRKVAGSNTGNIYLGDAAAMLSGYNQTGFHRVNHQGVTIVKETTFNMPIPCGRKGGTWIDLSTIYIDSDNNGDGVSGGYILA
jgi:hypothetical protein